MKRKIVSGVAGAAVLGAALFGFTAPARAATNYGPTSAYCKSVLYKVNTTNSQALWCQLQGGPSRFGGYTGPVDGVPGVNTWKGLQTWLRRFGYTGPIDGVPGTNTYKALQRWGQRGGYTGPVDGVMGPNSWAGLGRAVKLNFFTD
jgi:hypothetical protein